MKKLLFLLTILFFFSCKKDEPTYCWICETTTTYEATHYTPEILTTSGMVCDKTESEIQLIEENKSSSIKIKIGTTIATTKIIVTCKKKQ